ncbi:Type I restriction-modification system methyltransferase subunit [Mannheimia haemolytica]|uniref:Type I restriction-modification system methyltransferase subunit n=1 Tax=Mannheimia haemolytica TaxID=75985 RepID=A0A378N9B4_MANHA|nr:Type I restriction-modification system methyltransferase subunit [Mannheimia haemolytica]
MPNSTAQHSTAQHSTAQHSTAQHSTAQHSTAQHSTAQRDLNADTSQAFLNELDQTLWTAADKLRKNLDAANYKHIVLGFIFLKYISDSFTDFQAKLKTQLTTPKANSILTLHYLTNKNLAKFLPKSWNREITTPLKTSFGCRSKPAGTTSNH